MGLIKIKWGKGGREYALLDEKDFRANPGKYELYVEPKSNQPAPPKSKPEKKGKGQAKEAEAETTE